MAQYMKPLPRITAANRPFWEGTRQGKFLLQKCRACGQTWHPITPLCPNCWSESFDWVPASGRGKVNAWMVYHQSFHPAYDHEIPYAVVEVELEEGPRVQTNLLGVAIKDLRMGMPVEAVFEAVTPEVTLVKFRPAGQ